MTTTPAKIEAAIKENPWLETYTLPCDVMLPPHTIIRRGCKLSTLITGLIAREPLEGKEPPKFPG
jgi:hypothetical protein